MKHEEIRKILAENLSRAGLEPRDTRVQRDPYEGWRIAVICEGFEDLSASRRREVTLAGLEGVDIVWADLLAPTELEWAGALPSDADLDSLPLWPEALGRARSTEPSSIVLPSDLDEDLDRPIFVTFYSLRGGVGRSTALAYTARILAAHGRKVVCVDMDLEAPGLAALFGCEQQVEDRQGVVELLLALDQGETPDFSKHLIRVLEREDLYCLPAGRPNAAYARRLRFVDPVSWYGEEQNPLHALVDGLKDSLPFTPDVIFLDSRTGITPLSGPLLFELADVAVVVFFPHPQAEVGTAALARALLSSHTRRTVGGRRLTPEPRFLVSPMPASKAREVKERYQHRALHWIGNWLSGPVAEQQGFVESDLTHFVSYREEFATSDHILPDEDVWRDFEPVAGWVEQFLPVPLEARAPELLATNKEAILKELRFATGAAEQQADFDQTFVETELVKRALDPDVPLILGRKGTGKTAMFRRLLKLPSTVMVLAPTALRGDRRWLMSVDGFQAIAKTLKPQDGVDWHQFWAFYTCFTTSMDIPAAADVSPPEELTAAVPSLAGKPPTSDFDVVKTWRNIIEIPHFGLLLNDWLGRIDDAIPDRALLLFDGLDTGFGIGQAGRGLRTDAISGLFSFFGERGESSRNLKFKIVLREDIWRQVRFENKSHLFGRSVSLQWRDQATFFKVLLKQAIQSPLFQKLVSDTDPSLLKLDLDRWTKSEVFTVWNHLVGERMKGGKTAFTSNWVWNRLADGNNDHSPRHLLQLFHQALEWERKEHPRSPYSRAVIRPRALNLCLKDVSHEALVALTEEFGKELEPLLDKLRQIGRTTVYSDTLKGLGEEVTLAREVGVLAIYEGTDDDVKRYQVPELYRHGLSLSRPGPR